MQKKLLKGVQLPIAGFRGSGLAWMVDIMSGVLTGANHGGKVKDPFDDFTGPQNVGHLFLALKPDLFVGKNYIKRIKENIKIIKRLPKIKGVKEIQYPGQGMNSRYKKNLKKDIVVPKNILEDLKKTKCCQIKKSSVLKTCLGLLKTKKRYLLEL